MRKNRSKNIYLHNLRNRFGNFYLQYLQRKEDGSINRTKRYDLLWFFSRVDKEEYERRNWMFNRMNQRTLLDNEIILDIDHVNKKQAKLKIKTLLNHKDFKRIFENRLDSKGTIINIRFFEVFESNSGYHIHILYDRGIDDDYRRFVINNIKRATNNSVVDSQILSRHMIALEFSEHWKNNNIIKKPVDITSIYKKRWIKYEK